ncbi:MAG: LLM class flavin-dependent oxidoreductase [Acidimicrobiia bacterium]
MTLLRMRFDLRVPPFARTDHAAQYRTMLEMVDWADTHGVANIALSEHHGDPAGYTPAPITLAAAVLSRTEHLTVSISASLVPLHDPVRLAEQIAAVDLIAPGRISVVLGAGYRKVEFAMAGVDRSSRGQLVAECAEVLQAAWTGEPFVFRGREVLVTPTPATPGGPTIYIGGKSVPAARRAARLRLPFLPAVADPVVVGAYLEEAERIGFDGAEVNGFTSLAQYQARPGADVPPPMVPGFVMVANDPDATWARIAENALYDAETYAAWQDDTVHSDWAVMDAAGAESLRTSGRYAMVTPAQCIELAHRNGGLILHPLMGGIEPELAWESLRLFETDVLPYL